MFSKIIKDLIGSGLSEIQIAEKLNSTQPTINRIRNDKQTPGGELAVALIGLLDEIKKAA